MLNLKIIILLLIALLNTQRVDDDDAIAGNNDACSFVWGISGGFYKIDSFYGTIGSIPWLGSGGSGEEGSQTWVAWRQFGGGKKSR